MRYKIVILLSLCVPSIHAMNQNHNPQITTGGMHREGCPEFFTSFINPELTYQSTLFNNTNQPIVDRVPLIGHYQNVETKKKKKTVGEYYNPRIRIALIEHDARTLDLVIPPSLCAALEKAGINDLSKVEFYTNILGGFAFPDQAPKGDKKFSCNVAFHPVIRRWRGTEFEKFNVPIQAGIFEPNGIVSIGNGISFNKLANLSVHYHDKIAFSPDNGRFRYDNNRAISTFWIAGIFHKHATVIFTIMAHNQETEISLLNITKQQCFSNVLKVMSNTCGTLNEADSTALATAISVLENHHPAQQEAPSSEQEKRAPSLTGTGHILGGTQPIKKPTKKHPQVHQEATSSAIDASSVDEETLNNMIEAFKCHLKDKKFNEALSLLDVIREINSDQATTCSSMFYEYLTKTS